MFSAVTRWYFKGLIHCDKLLNYVIFCLFHLFWFVISFGFDILICWRKNLNNVFLYFDLHILWFWKTALECCILHYWHTAPQEQNIRWKKTGSRQVFCKGMNEEKQQYNNCVIIQFQENSWCNEGIMFYNLKYCAMLVVSVSVVS